MCDGTFKTAPSTSDNKHFYQNLILYAKYGDHVLPFMKAIMTGKCRPLYDKTFQKMKEHLPSSVNPETVMSDYEQAIQGALSDILRQMMKTMMIRTGVSFVGLLIFGFYFTSKILLVKVHLLVNRNNIVKKTLSEMKC